MKRKSSKRSPDAVEHMSVLLKKLVDLMERSSNEEFELLLRGDGELKIQATNRQPKKTDSMRRQVHLDATLSEIADKLRSLQTREAGRELLGSEFLTRASIEKFVRFLDLPVHRTDTIEILQERTIEAEIGSRLRSDAVQGKKGRQC